MSGGQQVAARGERLAELHEDRPELLERQAQPRAARQAAIAARTTSTARGRARAGTDGKEGGRDEVIEAVTDQDVLDLQEPQDDPRLHRFEGLVQLRDARFEAVGSLALLVDLPQEFVHFGSCHEVAAFFRRYSPTLAAKVAAALRPHHGEAAQDVADLVGGDVADMA